MADWLTNIITVLIASGFSVAVALIALRVNTKTAKETTTATISVQAQEADTHAFTAILNGYDGIIESVKSELSTAKEELQRVSDRLDTVERDNFALSRHLDLLESMIPNPPGPPPRPTLGRR